MSAFSTNSRIIERVLGLILAVPLCILVLIEIVSFEFVRWYSNAWIAIATVFGVYAAFIVVHELGHVIAALCMRLPIREIRLAWLRLHFLTDGRFARADFKGQDFGGYVCISVPTGPNAFRRWFLFVLGGPLASVALASLLLVVACTRNNDMPERPLCDWSGIPLEARATLPVENFLLARSLGGALANFAASFCLFLTILNLIPMSNPATDVTNLFLISKFQNREMFFLHEFVNQERTPFRPREWSCDFFEQVAPLRADPSFLPSALMLDYYHHVDSGRMHDAGNALERVIELIGATNLFPGTCYEAAYFYARSRGDLSTARRYFELAGGRRHSEPQTRLRAEAAILFAEGRFAEARDKAFDAIVVMRDCADIGGAISEREWLATLAIKAEAMREKENRDGPAWAS